MPQRYTAFIISSIAAFAILLSPIRAQDTAAFPTLDALEQTLVPAADYVSLAQRFRGVGAIPAPPTTAPVRPVGDTETFWVSNSIEQREFQVSATLRTVGQHIYLWVENGASVDDSDLQALANAFDNRVYDAVHTLWGSEPNPGIDGDSHIYVLFAHDIGSGVAAYFLSRHLYPRQVFPTSNEHEMLFYNLDPLAGGSISDPLVESNISHEFQHMIRASLHPNEDIWLNEGFSTFTQLYLYHDPGSVYSFLALPQAQVNTWSADQFRSAHYGAATLFVDYFYERYGLDAVHALSLDPADGLTAFDHVLTQMGQPGVNDFFADWVLANALMQPDSGYGYHLLPAGMPSPTPLAVVTEYPFSVNGTSNQYAANYYVMTNLKDKTALDIQVQSPDTVAVIPAQAASGQWMWYSNRGDNSDPTLTHAFDLSGVSHATLSYKAWYYLENLWDYGYISVSADGGATWTILSTPHTTDANPLSTAYGAGYTSESSGWVDETVSLDAYAGKSVLLRFETVTDDAINQPGLALDAVSIPEIGYQSDFETDGGGWDAAGWVRMDNRLPQRVWVQAVQQIGSQIQVSRWSAPAENHWTIPLAQNVDQVLIAVSPFAPITTVPMRYSLQVAAS